MTEKQPINNGASTLRGKSSTDTDSQQQQQQQNPPAGWLTTILTEHVCPALIRTRIAVTVNPEWNRTADWLTQFTTVIGNVVAHARSLQGINGRAGLAFHLPTEDRGTNLVRIPYMNLTRKDAVKYVAERLIASFQSGGSSTPNFDKFTVEISVFSIQSDQI